MTSPLTDLILIRHGQSLGNIACSDHPDCELSPRGIEQARELAENLCRLPLDGFVGLVSPYRRAIQTAEFITARTGLTFAIENGIREFGPRAEIGERVFQPETLAEFAARMKAFLSQARGKVLLVSHGSPIAALAQLANGFEPTLDGPFHSGIGNARFRWISDPTPFARFN